MQHNDHPARRATLSRLTPADARLARPVRELATLPTAQGHNLPRRCLLRATGRASPLGAELMDAQSELGVSHRGRQDVSVRTWVKVVPTGIVSAGETGEVDGCG